MNGYLSLHFSLHSVDFGDNSIDGVDIRRIGAYESDKVLPFLRYLAPSPVYFRAEEDRP